MIVQSGIHTGAGSGCGFYTDLKKVSDEDIKKLRSRLTVVGGKGVYNDMH